MQQLDGHPLAQREPGAGARVEVAFQGIERAPYLRVLAQHDEHRGRQSRLGFAQQREQELLFQVDVAAQRADRACQRLPVPGCGGERRDARVDLVVLSFESRRQ